MKYSANTYKLNGDSINPDTPIKLKKFRDTRKDNKLHRPGDIGVSLVNKFIITDSHSHTHLDPNDPRNKTVRKGYRLEYKYFVTESNLYMCAVIDEKSSLNPIYTIAFKEHEFEWESYDGLE